MNAIEILKSQHREVEALFEAFEEAEEDPGTQQQVFLQIADALAAHATIEEKHFYPAVVAKQTEDLLREALEEHLAAKRIIADLLELSPDDDTFVPKVMVLKEQIEHHVEEEEGDLFIKVNKLFKKTELAAIGVAMENTYAELMAEGDPRLAVPEETEEAAPLS